MLERIGDHAPLRVRHRGDPRNQRRARAKLKFGAWGALLALVLAIPGVLAAFFLLIVVLSNPRWN